MTLALTLLIVLLVFTFSSMVVLFPTFKYYKKSYDNLKNKTFFRLDDLVFIDEVGEISADTFIWFKKPNSFLISKGVYLHNSIVTFSNPYSLYWLLKFQRFMKNSESNIKPSILK